MSKQLRYYDYEREAEITCPKCGWSGRPGDHEEYYEQLLDVCCPKCGTMLLIVSYPTIDETRAAAAQGNKQAVEVLSVADQREAFLEEARRSELKSPSQLPDLDDASIVIDWDFEEQNGKEWTVLRYGATVIWRERAYYEGFRRLEQVVQILQEKYGARLKEVRPTSASHLYLYGDNHFATDFVDKVNARLAGGTESET